MSELLLELFSEEIPALMQVPASESYKKIFENFLLQQQVKYESIKVFCGPRRITIYIEGLPAYIDPITNEIKGPKIDAPQNAITGFYQSHQISQEELIIKKIKDIEYYFFIQKTEAKKTSELFRNALGELIDSYTWPKSMYWGKSEFKWVRPLRNILCLFDGEVIKFNYRNLESNNKTYGRRFTKNSEIGPVLEVENFADYKKKLEDNLVILDQNIRSQIIENEIYKIAKNGNLQPRVNIKLLEEVTGLVEWPNIMIGQIDKKFLKLPIEVLVSSMQTNQRYFNLFENEKRIASNFIFVADGNFLEPELVVQGNQKVLYARLSDALYFYEQDLKNPIEKQLDKLKEVIFHTKLGNLYEKSLRLQKIVQFISPSNEALAKAALICKTDIISEMVGEFPNLQGIMGYYYAIARNESDNFASTIKDHYKPQGAKDDCAKGDAAILALADKIDNLTGLILAGEEPTGSKDPFALRRQALGIIRLIFANNLSINIVKLIDYSLNLYQQNNFDIREKIILFLEERIKNYLKEEYPQNIILAVLNLKHQDDLLKLISKIKYLASAFTNQSDSVFITIYRRMSNILGNKKIDLLVKQSLFQHGTEQLLYDFWQENMNKLEKAKQEENYQLIYHTLLAAEKPLADFFENVMVNSENIAIANNRLALLKNIKNLFDQFADFSKL
ncbi:MAG: glycine--tRNA ligase subunit beta [Rickettsiaceae bacterium]|nr:glycine--tRNA ligase subunit beta [Rickettsiaceae bacterium]